MCADWQDQLEPSSSSPDATTPSSPLSPAAPQQQLQPLPSTPEELPPNEEEDPVPPSPLDPAQQPPAAAADTSQGGGATGGEIASAEASAGPGEWHFEMHYVYTWKLKSTFKSLSKIIAISHYNYFSCTVCVVEPPLKVTLNE